MGPARRDRAAASASPTTRSRASPKVPDADGWSEADALLLRAADELHDDQTLSDATYAALAARYDVQQLLDLVFTVGQYHLVSMALNAFRAERDDDVTGVPIPTRE